MPDLYTQITNNPLGKLVAGNVGLPVPTPITRWSPGDPVLDGTALIGAAPGGRLAASVGRTLAHAEVAAASPLAEPLRSALADADLDAGVWNPEAPSGERFKALVFDATGIKRSEDLAALHRFFHPAIRTLRGQGRVLVLGTAPEDAEGVREATAQRALEGFTRSLGKELRAASTVSLVYVAPGAEDRLESTLRFLLSAKSAFVSGQVIRVGTSDRDVAVDWDRPLDGQVALVTGASRGIGASIAEVLARDGAHVVGLDVPALGEGLKELMDRLGGSAIELDITGESAPQALAAQLRSEHGGVDVVVHNAGVTRDKTVAGMKDDQWDLVLDVNLIAQERIDDALLEAKALKAGARIVSLSSMNGIAGAKGQTNYAASKAGIIGMVQALAPQLKEQGHTLNAVAPGFIETAMTAAMPIGPRQVGRMINSVQQGGQPVDVAETIAWMANPASSGVTGNVLRVDGQNFLGA